MKTLESVCPNEVGKTRTRSSSRQELEAHQDKMMEVMYDLDSGDINDMVV